MSEDRGVTWWALLDPNNPPLAVGRSPQEAEAHLHRVLVQFFREECDPLPADPALRAQEALDRFKQGALVSGTAVDELTAFLTWRQVSQLLYEEALLRWREAFPAPVDREDPLVEAPVITKLPSQMADGPGGHRIRRRRRGRGRG